MGRSILACVAGLILGMALFVGIEMLGHVIFPPPAGMDPTNAESIRANIDKISIGAFLMVLSAYFIGTFAGAWLAATLARRGKISHALVIGGIMLFAGIMNLVMIPHPYWFAIACVVIYPVAALLGGLVAARRASR